MKVFIVILAPLGVFCNIESVWSTKELAKIARHYHANQATRLYEDYIIIAREVDRAHKS